MCINSIQLYITIYNKEKREKAKATSSLENKSYDRFFCFAVHTCHLFYVAEVGPWVFHYNLLVGYLVFSSINLKLKAWNERQQTFIWDQWITIRRAQNQVETQHSDYRVKARGFMIKRKKKYLHEKRKDFL